MPGYSRPSRSRVRRARPAGRARASLLGGGGGVGHRGARVSTGTVAPMRHLDIAGDAGTAHVGPASPRAGRSPSTSACGRRRPRTTSCGAALDAVAARAAVSPGCGCGAATRRWPTPLERVGFQEERSLHQLRRPLPVDAAVVPRCAAVRGRPGRGGLAGGQQPRVRLAPRTGRMDARGPRGSGWPSRGSIPPGSCCTRRTAACVGFCWTKVHRDERPGPRRDLRDRGRPGRRREGPRPAADAGRARPPPPAGPRPGMLYVDGANAPALAPLRPARLHRPPHRRGVHDRRWPPR